MKSIVYIIAGALSGKSTLCRLHPGHFGDPDDARNDALEAVLRPLREANDWAQHNTLWHRALREWVKTVTVDAVFAHSYADAMAMVAVRPGGVMFWDVPIAAFAQRLNKLATADAHRCQLAILNRATNYTDKRVTSLPRWDGTLAGIDGSAVFPREGVADDQPARVD